MLVEMSYFVDRFQLVEFAGRELYGGRRVRHVFEPLVFRFFDKVLCDVDRRVFTLNLSPNEKREWYDRREWSRLAYLTDFFPYFIATGLFLETEGQVEIIAFRPDYQRFLLFLVGRIGLDLGFEQQRTYVGKNRGNGRLTYEMERVTFREWSYRRTLLGRGAKLLWACRRTKRWRGPFPGRPIVFRRWARRVSLAGVCQSWLISVKNDDNPALASFWKKQCDRRFERSNRNEMSSPMCDNRL